MERAKVKKDGRAFGVNKVDIAPGHYIDPLYRIVPLAGGRISPTGHLKVFEVSPTQPRLPAFIGRWDERDDSLDIDITNTGPVHKMCFRRGWRGYAGHHPQRVNGDSRTYDVRIELPNGTIFDGRAGFGLDRELELGDKVTVTESMEWEIKRAGLWRRLLRLIGIKV